MNNSLKPNADILFYGCDLAKGQKGEAFLDIFQANAHVDIAASNDLTGNADTGGDWDLEIQRGVIDTEQPFSEIALKDFSTVLASYPPPDFCSHAGNYCGGSATETSSDTSRGREHH